MSMSDPIADFVARIRNGITARKSRIDIPSSKLKVRIAEFLKQEGYLTAAEVVTTESRPVLQLSVRYDNHHKIPINGILISSTPGQRNYVGKDKVPRVRFGLGTAIVTTSKGVMTDRDARKAGLGGEVLCEVW